uniref:F-box protein 40, tandem duplicate 1 n=1 Tax=Echeneis naucrates TaxID=173247 RepID=A0A665TC54_ECHNA
LARHHRSRQHVHCDSCYSRRCRTRVEVSVSCAVIPCRLHCGALFHLCKEEDHLLLCPNVRVPCLNAEYGCPVHLARSSRAAHLQVCPASVVSCSMEWNRWPANDAHSYPNTELHERLLTEREKGGSLDLAMALKDQERLFHSIKMKKLFPELIQKDEDEDEAEAEHELSQEEREAIARASGVDTNLLDIYRAWENMFSMEMGGCREAGGAAVAGRGQDLAKRTQKNLGTLTEEDTADACLGAAASSGACVAPSTSSNKLMKKFIYGSMEPMKITTVRTFKIPTSFSAKQSRIRNPSFYKRESRAVDTSDLGVVPEDMPVWEEVQASLLCSLEKEQRGHLIAEGVCTDGLLQDEGSQTYNFPSAPFRRNTSLADLTVGKPLELHLQLQVESVTSRHHKASSAFTFLCGHTFQRREYGIHYSHEDNTWTEKECPLAYLGCTYRQRRFQPSTHEASVSYNEDLGCFSLHPKIPVYLGEASQPSRSSVTSSSTQRARRGQVGGGDGSLSSLPYEVLCHMASFLDSLSLSQLALVSRLMRQVVSSLLQDRGMVTLRWERKTYSHGGAKWRVWQFSTLFSPVDAWCFQDVPSMSEHLKVCPYYERESRTERIQLPRIREEVQTNTSCKAPTLVSLFQKKRIMM